MKHISEIIATMPEEWKQKAGVTVNGDEIIARMAAAGELDFLDRVAEPPKKLRAKSQAQR